MRDYQATEMANCGTAIRTNVQREREITDSIGPVLLKPSGRDGYCNAGLHARWIMF